MKSVMIAYSQAIDHEVWDVLVDNIVGCTKWKKVAGEGDLHELVHLLLAAKRVHPPWPVGHGRRNSLGPSPLACGVHLGTKRGPKLATAAPAE